MNIEIGTTNENFTTAYAPLAVVLAVYRAKGVLQPLYTVPISMKGRDFTPADKLIQVLISILAGCETLSLVNIKLKREEQLARIGGWPRFADQSNLSRMLDGLTLKQIDLIQQAGQEIRRSTSQLQAWDWRKHLWLDFDLSGLVCSAQAEESEKGYFSEKKRYGSPISPGKCR
jgi:hypothetical protein